MAVYGRVAIALSVCICMSLWEWHLALSLCIATTGQYKSDGATATGRIGILPDRYTRYTPPCMLLLLLTLMILRWWRIAYATLSCNDLHPWSAFCTYLNTAEIARVGGHYAVQAHSMSLILSPVESPYICDFLLMNNINLQPVYHCLPDVAEYWSNYCFWQGLPLSNKFVLRNFWLYRHKSYIAIN